jgi:GAF domain-containing protein
VIAAGNDPRQDATLQALGDRLEAAPNDALGALFRPLTPELVPDLEPAALAARVPDPTGVALLSSLGARSFIRVPLAARERSLGTITLVSAQPGRYGPGDLDVAADLAHRIAFAVDNARLYQQARTAITVREEFLSIASHELRTPLTPLMLQFQRLVRLCQKEQLTRPPRPAWRRGWSSASACSRAW